MRYEPQVQCSRLYAHPTQLFIITASATRPVARNSLFSPYTGNRVHFSVKVNSKEISSAVLVTNIPIYNEPQIKLYEYKVHVCNSFNALYIRAQLFSS